MRILVTTGACPFLPSQYGHQSGAESEHQIVCQTREIGNSDPWNASEGLQESRDQTAVPDSGRAHGGRDQRRCVWSGAQSYHISLLSLSLFALLSLTHSSCCCHCLSLSSLTSLPYSIRFLGASPLCLLSFFPYAHFFFLSCPFVLVLFSLTVIFIFFLFNSPSFSLTHSFSFLGEHSEYLTLFSLSLCFPSFSASLSCPSQLFPPSLPHSLALLRSFLLLLSFSLRLPGPQQPLSCRAVVLFNGKGVRRSVLRDQLSSTSPAEAVRCWGRGQGSHSLIQVHSHSPARDPHDPHDPTKEPCGRNVWRSSDQTQRERQLVPDEY